MDLFERLEVRGDKEYRMSNNLSEAELAFVLPALQPSPLNRDYGLAHSHNDDLSRFDLPYVSRSPERQETENG